jgi:hypothetical protein
VVGIQGGINPIFDNRFNATKESKNKPMKKITLPVFIGIVLSFTVVLVVVAIVGTILYNQHNYNSLISSFHHPFTISINSLFGVKEIYPTKMGS